MFAIKTDITDESKFLTTFDLILFKFELFTVSKFHIFFYNFVTALNDKMNEGVGN